MLRLEDRGVWVRFGPSGRPEERTTPLCFVCFDTMYN